MLILVFDKIATSESSVLLSQTLSMSFYKYSGQSQKHTKLAKVAVIVHYYIDLLESTYSLLKVALAKNEGKSANLIKGKLGHTAKKIS